MSRVVFEDYSVKVKGAIDDRINAVLEECAAEVESRTKRNSRVDTGKTKNSYQHKVVDSEHVAYIGSNDKNAIWEEFGTGEFALEGNGRKGGWWYPVDKPGFFGRLFGKKPSKFVFTYGKKPSRPMYKAYNSLKSKIQNHIQEALRGL